MSENQKNNSTSIMKKVDIALSVLQNKDTIHAAAEVAKGAQDLLTQAGDIFHKGKSAFDAHQAKSRRSWLSKIFTISAQNEKGVFKQSLTWEFPLSDKTMSLLSDAVTISHASDEKMQDFTLQKHALTQTYSAAIDEENVLGKSGFQLHLYCHLIEKGGEHPYRALEFTGGLYNMNAVKPECLEQFHSVVQLTDEHDFQEYDTGNQKILLPRRMKRRFGQDEQNRLILTVEVI